MSAQPDGLLMRGAARGIRWTDRVSARDLESLALFAGAVAFVGGAIAALVAFRFASAPIAGPDSIGQFAALASAFVALLCAAVARYLASARAGERPRLLDHLDIAALAIAHAIVALLGWTLLAAILAEAFLGAEVFPLAVIVLAGVATAVTAYVSFTSAATMDSRRLAMLFAAFFVLGVLAAMLATSDPDWWKDNLSALGVTTNASARAFNLTLIVSGFLVTSLARSATRTTTTGTTGLLRVRTCLVVLGVFLALVGLFPVDIYFVIHVGVSLGMVVAFGVLVTRLPRWMPGLARPFIVLGWLFLALMTLFGVFYAVGYYTLTAVELIGGALVFTWVILFIRNTAALEADTP
ncbi:DUF998 domain-containing protein [Microbacterium sp.]|jgi:hypothetical membrane protein|uniref:DUF998 domain-containing protein n=1 Tax=Microbacterium sp. TaxID=51671 RepID=UPI002B89642B|nr:DUF998 domain-containing protein [Microbacterium sp.]HWL77321.1 DUF998 domain-containing protein [Microbacterium sp.]